MHDPSTQHIIALKRIIRYIKDTIHHGLHLSPSLVDALLPHIQMLIGEGAHILEDLRPDIVSTMEIV